MPKEETPTPVHELDLLLNASVPLRLPLLPGRLLPCLYPMGRRPVIPLYLPRPFSYPTTCKSERDLSRMPSLQRRRQALPIPIHYDEYSTMFSLTLYVRKSPSKPISILLSSPISFSSGESKEKEGLTLHVINNRHLSLTLQFLQSPKSLTFVPELVEEYTVAPS
jgi:hypothetical protein